jgi:tetratricopeptide (TPR) repeat protein
MAYAEGQALFDKERYEEARAAFQRAHNTIPNPVVLLPIAECDFRMGKLEEAYQGFERYLQERPDAPERTEVEQKMADLREVPALVGVTSAPAGAAIKVDGQDTGQVTPATVEIVRGEHIVELTLAGHNPSSKSIETRIGGRYELAFTLEPLPPPPPVAQVDDTQPPRDTSPPTAAMWATGVIGAAGMVTGSVLGFMALSERSDFDDNPTAESADRGERLALFADVAFGVGAMALITGAVLYLTAGEAEGDAAADTARFQLTPTVAPDGAAVRARMRF